MKIKNQKELEVWNKGIEIVDFVYKVTESFPGKEKFGLTSQMRRASVSIPSNISEGFARQYNKEFRQFCYIASGSRAELETLMIIAKRREYLMQANHDELLEMIDHESRMIKNLIKRISIA